MSSASDPMPGSRLLRKTAVAGLAVLVLVLAGIAFLGPRSHPEHGKVAETFPVPSSRAIGIGGMAAQVQGMLTLNGDCPVLETEVGNQILVLPWAVGVTYQDGTKAVVHRLTGGVYAVEGGLVDGGGGVDEPGPGQAWPGNQPAKAATSRPTSTSTPGRKTPVTKGLVARKTLHINTDSPQPERTDVFTGGEETQAGACNDVVMDGIERCSSGRQW